MFDLFVAVWFSVLTHHAPRLPAPRLRELAVVVARTTEDPTEQALLMTVDFHETTWGNRGIRFGLSGVRVRLSLADAARVSLRALRRASALCRGRPEALLGFYHHGNGCRPDPYSRSEATTLRRLLQLYRARSPAPSSG